MLSFEMSKRCAEVKRNNSRKEDTKKFSVEQHLPTHRSKKAGVVFARQSSEINKHVEEMTTKDDQLRAPAENYIAIHSTEDLEFGGPKGCVLLILWSHYILFYFWYEIIIF